MFNSKNSTSATVAHEKTDSVENSLKIYVAELDPERKEYFRNTLKEFIMLRDYSIELKDKYNECLHRLNKAMDEHERVVSELHDHLCKKLALLGYNEFKHQVHVDKDGKVFIIPKDIIVVKEDVE